MTWPRADEVATVLRDLEPAERANALKDLRVAWHDNIRQTAQVVAVGPLVPLLGTIIGYVLGREHTQS